MSARNHLRPALVPAVMQTELASIYNHWTREQQIAFSYGYTRFGRRFRLLAGLVEGKTMKE
jgi:hypothetical protein